MSLAPAPGMLELLLQGGHGDPHSILGIHLERGTVVVRALRPGADRVVVIHSARRTVLRGGDHGRGVFWGTLPGETSVPDYRLEVSYGAETFTVDDPYRWLPTLGPIDLHLLGQGRHERTMDALGARPDDVGTAFRVWAPQARGVRLAGDMNTWDATMHPMRRLDGGVWELFVPGVGPGARYRFDVLGADGVWRDKADPMAQRSTPEAGATSIVWRSTHLWDDDQWLQHRQSLDPRREPLSIYEVHLGSWRRGLSYDDLAQQLPDYVADLGFTHVELMPVNSHPFQGSWGYQVTGYLSVDARLGDPDGFARLVDAFHRRGVAVIVDWVPAHFPKDSWALARFDGTALYEHPDPRRGEHPEWGTLVFDFGRPEVQGFLLASALHLLTDLHCDGLRVDAVASMLYLDYAREDGEWDENIHGGNQNLEAEHFVKRLTHSIRALVPGGITIAEESTAWPGVTSQAGLGFTFKWDLGWMHETLGYLKERPEHRSCHHNRLTFPMLYNHAEAYVLPLSHDEVVHGKGSIPGRSPGTDEQRLSSLRALLGMQWAHPGKSLVFMGTELGMFNEWDHTGELPWWLLDHRPHAGVQAFVRSLNAVYRAHPSLWRRDHEGGGMMWLDADDAVASVAAWVRWGDEGDLPVVCATHWHHEPKTYRLGLPHAGAWEIVLNSDTARHGGHDVAAGQPVLVEDIPWQGQPCSTAVTLPGLSALWLAPVGSAAG